jgi:hypothetical protein
MVEESQACIFFILVLYVCQYSCYFDSERNGNVCLSGDLQLQSLLKRILCYGSRPVVVTCLWQARRIIFYFLLVEYRSLPHFIDGGDFLSNLITLILDVVLPV